MQRFFGRIVPAAALLGLCGLAATAPQVSAADVKIGLIELKGKPLERTAPLAAFLGTKGEATLRDITEVIDRAAARDDLQGVVLQLKDAELNTTQVEEIGARLAKLRAGGKKVHIFAEQYGPAQLVLGSYADEIIVQSGGGVSFPGLHMEEMFLADTLAWVGLKADMVQIGDYKGASEAMANRKPSAQWDQNINQLLDSLYGNIRGHIKEGRKLDDKQLDAAMDVSWMADAGPAKKVGLVDDEMDLAKLSDHLGSEYKGEVSWTPNMLEEGDEKVDLSNIAGLLGMLASEPDRTPTKPTIAILHIDGTIVDGDSGSGGLLGGSDSVGSRTMRRAMDEIADEDMIKGVIVRIDSPGGSAMASEVIWQGLRQLAAKKPVWASVGSMAASGGYYCAVGTDKIYVNPSSIVGSIGVVGGKVSMTGLYDMLKVNVVERNRGPKAGVFSSATPWSEADRKLIREKMTDTYNLFTKRVTAGRTGINLSDTAEGRLFTGNKAIGLKMADKVGGIDDAIADLAASLKISDYGIQDFPAPKSIGEVIEDKLGGFVMAPDAGDQRAARAILSIPAEFLGPNTWPQIRQGMQSILLLRREPVLTVMPSVLIVR